ncbi:hypothetical protein R1flu_004750 [Riccia fluitans]|uniref:Uncharacterized protein n=1 Tax=Riccia fluitans TaxID=41844 RepID=A0ABD1YR63_9MARC
MRLMISDARALHKLAIWFYWVRNYKCGPPYYIGRCVRNGDENGRDKRTSHAAIGCVENFWTKGAQDHNMPPILAGPSLYVLPALPIPMTINPYGTIPTIGIQAPILPALGYGIPVAPAQMPMLQVPTPLQYQNQTDPTIQRLIAQVKALQMS